MKLADYFDEYGVEKADFSAAIGCTRSALYRYINMTREPSLAVAVNIEKVTRGKVRVEDLVIHPVQFRSNHEDLMKRRNNDVPHQRYRKQVMEQGKEKLKNKDYRKQKRPMNCFDGEDLEYLL